MLNEGTVRWNIAKSLLGNVMWAVEWGCRRVVMQ